MKEYDNSKIHISSNFLLSICLLIMLDTLLLGPSLHCNTSLHFTTLHPTTLHYTYRHFTSSHLHFTTLSFGLNHLHFLPLYFTSHHQTQYSSPISKLISKIMNPFTVLNKPSPFHFTFYLLFFHLSYQTFTSLYFAIHIYNSLPFPSFFTFYCLHFPSLVFTFLTFVLKICVLPWEVPIAPSGSRFQSVMGLFRKEYFPMSVLCFLALIFQ